MSVLVKGMKMPENCIKCPLQFGGWCYASPPEIDERVAPTVDEAWEQGKPDWCPLVALPDHHGRLVDADATIKEIKARNPDDVSYEDAWAITCIEHAPTIEPEPHWIPCSRELPDTREFTSKTVLCCDKYGGIYTATYNKLGEWHDDAEYADLTDVIAWMPLPEAFREGEGC